MFSETEDQVTGQPIMDETQPEFDLSSIPNNPDAGWPGEIAAAEKTYELALQALEGVRLILRPDLVVLFEQEIAAQYAIIEDAKTISPSEDEDAFLEFRLRVRPPQRELSEIWRGLSAIAHTVRSLNRAP